MAGMRRRKLFPETDPLNWTYEYHRQRALKGDFMKLGMNIFHIDAIKPHTLNPKKEVVFASRVDTTGKFQEMTFTRNLFRQY